MVLHSLDRLHASLGTLETHLRHLTLVWSDKNKKEKELKEVGVNGETTETQHEPTTSTEEKSANKEQPQLSSCFHHNSLVSLGADGVSVVVKAA